jgi:hypothetical protein
MTQIDLQAITELRAFTIYLPHANATLSDVLPYLPHPSIFVHRRAFLPLSTSVRGIPKNIGPVICFRDLAGPVPDRPTCASFGSFPVDEIDSTDDIPVRRPFVASPVPLPRAVRFVRPALPSSGAIAEDARLDRATDEWRRIREIHDSDDRADSAWNWLAQRKLLRYVHRMRRMTAFPDSARDCVIDGILLNANYRESLLLADRSHCPRLFLTPLYGLVGLTDNELNDFFARKPDRRDHYLKLKTNFDNDKLRGMGEIPETQYPEYFTWSVKSPLGGDALSLVNERYRLGFPEPSDPGQNNRIYDRSLNHISILDRVNCDEILEELCKDSVDYEWWLGQTNTIVWLFSIVSKHMLVTASVILDFVRGRPRQSRAPVSGELNPRDRWNKKELRRYFAVLREMGLLDTTDTEVDAEFDREGGDYGTILRNFPELQRSRSQ